MDNMELLATALEYIENHLEEDVRTEDAAKSCFCSKSTLEKLFRCVMNISVRDYIVMLDYSKTIEKRSKIENSVKGFMKKLSKRKRLRGKWKRGYQHV